MTTPNIKALAEEAKEENITDREYDLASALLRVLEDGDRLNRSLKIRHNPQKCMNDDELLGEHCLCCEALESHNKLWEELGDERKDKL